MGRTVTDTDRPEATEESALVAIGRVLSSISHSTFELEKVLQTVIDSAVRLTNATDGNILRDEGGTFRMAAYTAGVLLHALKDGRFVISHIARGRWSAYERERNIRQYA